MNEKRLDTLLAPFRGLSARFKRYRLGSAFADELLLLSEELARPTDFKAMMEALCLRTRRLMGCDRCSIFLLDGELYRARFNSGNPADVAQVFANHRVPKDDPLIARAVELRRAVSANDAVNDRLMDKNVARRAGIRAIVVTAIFDDEQNPIGFMTAEFNQTKSTFRGREVRLFEALVGIAGLAVRHHYGQEERRREAEKLQVLNQLATVGRFAGGLAHDFNNRLTAVIGLCDLMMIQHRGTELEADLEELARSGEAAAELSRHLLEMATGAGQTETQCDLAFHFRSIESLLRPLVPSSIELMVDSREKKAYAAIAQLDLLRVLSNLVVNAVEACSTGDRIRISLTRDRGSDASSHLADPGVHSGQPLLVIEVSDSGEGMDPAVLGRIFDGSFSTRTRGVGLGLGIVKSIVEGAGGRVEVTSKPDEGSTFRISLPEVVEVPARAPEPSDLVDPLTRSLRLLVVDDDESVRRVLVKALEMHGHEVMTASNGHDALDVAFRSRAGIDALITDVTMPGMTGIELAIMLRSRLPQLKVLLMSAYSASLGGIHDDALQDAAFLAKPFGPERLLRELSWLVPESSARH